MLDLSDAIRQVIQDVIQKEIPPVIAQAVAEALGRQDLRPASPAKRWLSLAEARARLAHGCRTQRMLEALRSRALRGRQEEFGRRCWCVDADDLQRWDEAGRPVAAFLEADRRGVRQAG